jgi:hypothetical protein
MPKRSRRVLLYFDENDVRAVQEFILDEFFRANSLFRQSYVVM